MCSVRWNGVLCLSVLLINMPGLPRIGYAQAGSVAAGGESASTQPASTGPTTSPSAATSPAASQSNHSRKVETIEHDFGKAWAGDTVKHTFELTNTADRVLEIRGVTASCGCTTTSKWEKQVAPGNVWTLEVTLATANRKGTLRKTVTVKTDAPNRPQVLLVLKGEIQPRFDFSPAETVTFGALTMDSAAKRTLTITNKLAEPVRFTQATSTSKSVKATLREVEEGQRYELDVETLPPLPEAGFLGTITLDTDLKDQPKVTVPVHGTVRPRICLSPKTISVPVPTTRDVHRSLQLVTTEGAKPQLLDVETSNPAITALVEPGPGNQAERIRVTVLQGVDLHATTETITIYTGDPEFPKLTCQVRPFRIDRAGTSRPASTRPIARRLERIPPAVTAAASQAAASQPSQTGRAN